MVGWHHQLNGHEFEQTPRDSGGWRSLVSVRLQRVRHDLATEQQQEPPNSWAGTEISLQNCSLLSLPDKFDLENCAEEQRRCSWLLCVFLSSLTHIPLYPSKPEAGRQGEEMLYLITSTDQHWFWFPLAIADVQIDFCSVGCLWV